ncbi:DUF86 domain-containing protein [Pueribacillus theae]|uniref:DUF86 domain-containing protein n=1 Tax=Pueribacillus theae TaxID=2171751 RepID=A0A2U1K4C8_9BACI|nr:DUF86 domain-containing protein [Pueribacillus theae]PWA11999.1 DUF86 domain-containing protein [Pueribacillus theae]
MYFVDRKKIEATLDYMESCLQTVEETESWDSKLSQLAFERIAHVVIESVIDVGNAMIDGFIMRDPGSYEDIIDILLDEKVIDESDAKMIKDFVSYRKEIVSSYITIDFDELHGKVFDNIEALKKFPSKIRFYLTEELGPVSAFLPDDSERE